MEPLSAAEAVFGGALVFLVPGFGVAKALFPERRIVGPDGVRWAIELVTLSLVVSVVLTVTVGYVLLAGFPGTFSATWGDPLLEAILGAIALVAFVVGWLEGAYGATPRARPPPEETESPGAWELSRQLDRLQRERGRLERELARLSAPEGSEAARLRSRLGQLLEEQEALRRRREAEYDL